ncbi:MAG: hypothetical protein RL434_1152, partial [Pseudomonadota bacterium]
ETSSSLKGETAELALATAALERAVQWVLSEGGRDPRLAAAGSVSYLKLWGIVVGGWQLLRGASLALTDLAANAGDPAFAKSKIAGARFFATQVLPQAEGLARAMEVGSTSVLVETAEAFG